MCEGIKAPLAVTMAVPLLLLVSVTLVVKASPSGATIELIGEK